MHWRSLWRHYHTFFLALGVLAALAVGVAFARRYFLPHTIHDQATPTRSVYTCPMHPEVRSDAPGNCPICGMRLVPLTPAPIEGSDPSTRAVHISPERQQLIGVKVEPVERRPAIGEIRTVGRIAFDPDLLVAQREYLAALQLGDRNLRESAEIHLRHMGISEGELVQLRTTRRTPTNLFLPKPGEAVWVYAPLYEHELPYVRLGTTVRITLPTGSEHFTGTVRSIDPMIDPQTRSAHVRIEVPGAGGTLRPEGFVNAEIQVGFGEHLVVPTSALLDSGERKMVFVQREEGRFEPREVQTGPSLGETLVVTAGLTEGELIVTRAAFLVDSESRLKGDVPSNAAPIGTGHETHQH